VILDADDRQGSALYWSERRDTDDVMVKDSSVAGLPLHVSRGRDSGKVDLIIIDTPANSKDIAMLAAEQADFVVILVAPRGLDVHSVLQTVKQVQQAGTPFAVILTQVPHQGGEQRRAGFAAKGVTLFDTALHFRKDFYKATPIGKTAIELDLDGKAAAELRAAFEEAKRLSGYTTKPISEIA
jgi:chromosome partitioning protein